MIAVFRPPAVCKVSYIDLLSSSLLLGTVDNVLMASRFLVRLGSKNALCLSASRSVATFVISPPKEALVQDLFSSDKNQGTKNRPSYSLKDATKAVSRRLQWATVNIDAPRSYEGVLSEESSQVGPLD